MLLRQALTEAGRMRKQAGVPPKRGRPRADNATVESVVDKSDQTGQECARPAG